jgi:hypothetical protein
MADIPLPCDPEPSVSTSSPSILAPLCYTHHCAIQVTWECDQFYGGSLDHHAIGGCPECFAALKAARAAYEASDDYADPGTPGPEAEAVTDPAEAHRDPFTE